MTLRTLNYGNYGIFLIMGHAGFCPSAVVYVPVFLPGEDCKAVSKAPKPHPWTICPGALQHDVGSYVMTWQTDLLYLPQTHKPEPQRSKHLPHQSRRVEVYLISSAAQ